MDTSASLCPVVSVTAAVSEILRPAVASQLTVYKLTLSGFTLSSMFAKCLKTGGLSDLQNPLPDRSDVLKSI